MYGNHHVRRHQGPASNQHSYDGRVSNPQPIPGAQNTQFPRNYPPSSVPPRNFSGSAAQSPRQSAQFVPPPVGGASPLESGRYTSMMSGTATTSNLSANAPQHYGQRMPANFTQPQMAYGSNNKYPLHSQSPNTNGPYGQNMPQNVQQSTLAGNHQYIYTVPQHMHMQTVQPRFVAPNVQNAVVTSGHATVQAASPSYYPNQHPPFFQPGAPMAGYTTDPTFVVPVQQSQQIQPPIMQPQMQQQPVSQQNARRKKSAITIRDPNTGMDVTNELLQSGKQSEATTPHTDMAVSTNAISHVPSSNGQEQIAAKFAAQVAAAATGTQTTSSQQAQAQTAHHVSSGKAATSQVDAAESVDKVTNTSSNIAGGEQKSSSFEPSTFSPTPVVTGQPDHVSQFPHCGKPSRPEPPVAVVQPITQSPPQNDPVVTSDIVISDPVSLKENILSEEKHSLKKADKDEKSVEAPVKATNPVTDVPEVVVGYVVTASNPADSSEPAAAAAVDDETDEVAAEPAGEATPQPAAVDTEEKAEASEIVDDTKLIPVADVPKEEEAEREEAPEPEKKVADSDVVDDQSEVKEPASAPAKVDVVVPEDAKTSSLEADTDATETRNNDDIVISPAPVQASEVKANSKDSRPSEKLDAATPPVVAETREPDVKTTSDTAQIKKNSAGEEKTEAKKPAVAASEKSEAEMSSKEKAEEPQYGDDQWSPVNPEGKKVYDRSFLLHFKTHPTAMSKPTGLSSDLMHEIVMDNPVTKGDANSLPFNGMYRGGDAPADFTPGYVNTGGGHGGHGGGGRSSSRNMRNQRMGGGHGMHHYGNQNMPPVKVIKSIARTEPELNRSKDAWKPKKAVEVKDDEDNATAEILRTVRSILNKLTPQKFGSLMQQVQALEINSEVRLRGVIDLIFEKAIDEPNFCEAYANMCRIMSQFRVTAPTTAQQGGSGGTQTVVEFRKILLTRCQKEFEKDRDNEEAIRKLKDQAENIPETATPQEKRLKEEELALAITKERRRMLGNIRFIGELFKLAMLTESIMHNCVMSLFKAKDEDSLESLCRLLTTIGKDLDHAKGKARMDQYFQQMKKLAVDKKISSRVRFMIQDVIDLRGNKWVPRAVQAAGPKTIDQIHADVKVEKEQQAAKAAAAAASVPLNKSHSRSGGGGRMGSRGGGGHGSGGDDVGWTKVPQKPMRYDPSKMKLSKSQFDESTVTFGPNRGRGGWLGRGKSGSGSMSTTRTGSGGYSSQRERERDVNDAGTNSPRAATPTMMNRFSALGGNNPDPNSPFAQRKANSRPSSREGDRYNRGGRDASTGGADSRQEALETARRMTGGRAEAPTFREPLPPPPQQQQQQQPPKQPALNETALMKKYASIVTEYLSIRNIKEASECYAELNAPAYGSLFVQIAMEETVENSAADDQKNVALLFCEFLKAGVITREQYIKGAAETIGTGADLELDLPKVWKCLADFVAPVLMSPENSVDFGCLPALTKALIAEGKALVFLSEILVCLRKHMDEEPIKRQWSQHRLSWNQFHTDSSAVSECLQNKGLTFLVDAAENGGSHAARGSKHVVDVTAELSSIVGARHATDDSTFDAIESKFNAETRQSSDFIRALTTAVCRHAIKGSENDPAQMDVDRNVIKAHCYLFKKFVDSEAKELEAVYALQRLYVDLENPPNVLRYLFDYLYDEDIISEQTFFKWEKDENPQESEGKGVALTSVRPFFTWLQDAEVESDE